MSRKSGIVMQSISLPEHAQAILMMPESDLNKFRPKDNHSISSLKSLKKRVIISHIQILQTLRKLRKRRMILQSLSSASSLMRRRIMLQALTTLIILIQLEISRALEILQIHIWQLRIHMVE